MSFWKKKCFILPWIWSIKIKTSRCTKLVLFPLNVLYVSRMFFMQVRRKKYEEINRFKRTGNLKKNSLIENGRRKRYLDAFLCISTKFNFSLLCWNSLWKQLLISFPRQTQKTWLWSKPEVMRMYYDVIQNRAENACAQGKMLAERSPLSTTG